MLTSACASVPLLALVAVLAVPPLSHAIELQPGAWQDTETGSENGKSVPPKVETSCLSPEDAKDPLKGFSPDKEMKGQCKTLDVKKSPDGILMHLICGDPKQYAMDIAVSYMFNNPRSYSGTVKSSVTMMGKTTTSEKTIEGKWVAATCKK